MFSFFLLNYLFIYFTTYFQKAYTSSKIDLKSFFMEDKNYISYTVDTTATGELVTEGSLS